MIAREDGQTTEVTVNDQTTWEETGKASQPTARRMSDGVVVDTVKLNGRKVAHPTCTSRIRRSVERRSPAAT